MKNSTEYRDNLAHDIKKLRKEWKMNQAKWLLLDEKLTDEYKKNREEHIAFREIDKKTGLVHENVENILMVKPKITTESFWFRSLSQEKYIIDEFEDFLKTSPTKEEEIDFWISILEKYSLNRSISMSEIFLSFKYNYDIIIAFSKKYNLNNKIYEFIWESIKNHGSLNNDILSAHLTPDIYKLYKILDSDKTEWEKNKELSDFYKNGKSEYNILTSKIDINNEESVGVLKRNIENDIFWISDSTDYFTWSNIEYFIEEIISEFKENWIYSGDISDLKINDQNWKISIEWVDWYVKYEEHSEWDYCHTEFDPNDVSDLIVNFLKK